jgi:hypothetical protein
MEDYHKKKIYYDEKRWFIITKKTIYCHKKRWMIITKKDELKFEKFIQLFVGQYD